MANPFYYNPATNELELTADPSPLRTSLGKRFGLNEISTARETLSPTKSHKEGGRIGLGGGTSPKIIENRKRKLYFDLNRDGFMNLFEYLQSALAQNDYEGYYK